MKVLIVGDLHGDWGKLNTLITKKNPDIVLVCGDFGWWPKMEIKTPVLYGKQKKWLLKGIKPGKSKVYWCDGNHEEHPLLPQDGKIHKMYDGVYFCSRGSRLILPDDRTVLFIGGANSVDKNLRTPGHDWFPEETIKNKDIDIALNGGKVDIVISHTCPESFAPYLLGGNLAKINDPSCIGLECVLERLKPELWYFGHWHIHKNGYTKGCYWNGLDYPGHRGRWWMWLPSKKKNIKAVKGGFMSREIKFRAWIKKEYDQCGGFMLYNPDNESTDYFMVSNGTGFAVVFDDEWLKDDAYEIMQYTGLKDKNGKEIYEGDIVNIYATENSPDCSGYRKGALMVSGPIVYKDNLAAFCLPKGLDFTIHHKKDLEIIGNIHQNKDLL
jgi:uncharacterized phage protein (TIGR01671 family)